MIAPRDLPSLIDLGQAIRAGSTTSEAATAGCLAAIRARDGAINAFIHVQAEEAMTAARAADAELRAGHDRGPVHGIPISIKDIIDMAGVRTTAASHVRREHVAARDAEVVGRLREAGAVIVGKTNLHEFALGTTNEESAYGPVHHPLDSSRSPGGSSGGSAASVLAGMACASIGTDTGGSIRIPAAVCGLVGLKPRFRDVPTHGVVPLSASLDHVGPLCATVADAAALFAAIADPRVLDGSSAPAPAPSRSLRLGVPRRYFLDLLDTEVAGAFDATCARLEAAGVRLDDVTIPHASQTPAIYLHIALTEAAAFHAKTLESRPGDYTPTVRARLEAGRYVLAEDYLRALRGREVLRTEVAAALAAHDALLLPAMAVPATQLGAATVRIGTADEPVRNVTLRLTQLFNITGHPAITIPCGATGGGLPIGAQLVGTDTASLLRIATVLEPAIRGAARAATPRT
jgi:aspartyl-tRNA(Asn)/glutamyl-tRNA(Gln) amidotransferase subunit A